MSEEIRSLPESVPQIVSDRVMEILGDLPDDKRVAFVATVTSAKAGYDARVAVMVRLGNGWSFATFTEKPYHEFLKYGAELRFVL